MTLAASPHFASSPWPYLLHHGLNYRNSTINIQNCLWTSSPDWAKRWHILFLNDPQDLKHNISKINIFFFIILFHQTEFLHLHSLTGVVLFFWFSADVYAFYFFEKKDATKREILNIANATPTNLHSSVSLNHIFSSVNTQKLSYYHLELLPPCVLGTYPYLFSYSKIILKNLSSPHLPLCFFLPKYSQYHRK